MQRSQLIYIFENFVIFLGRDEIIVLFLFAEVDPVINTTDYMVVKNELQSIRLGGSKANLQLAHDCPEHSIHGILESLKYAEPKSIMFVFTDDDANDYDIEDEVREILLEKQINVFFLLTYSDVDYPQMRTCKKPRNSARPGYAVYERLAQGTNGLIYNMKKKSVEDVLIAVSSKIKSNYASFLRKDHKYSLKNVDKVDVDSGVSQVTFTVVGKKPKLIVYDSFNKMYQGKHLGDNGQTLTIDNPQNGTWTVHSEDSSPYSIEIGGLVENTFDYGFSLNIPSTKSETSYQPIAGNFYYIGSLS